jgi:hypothetical protein
MLTLSFFLIGFAFVWSAVRLGADRKRRHVWAILLLWSLGAFYVVVFLRDVCRPNGGIIANSAPAAVARQWAKELIWDPLVEPVVGPFGDGL